MEANEYRRETRVAELTDKIIIVGITEDGKIFRPSDWAERMCGNLSTFRNQRVLYSPLLQPYTYEDASAVLIDLKLKEKNPDLFKYILEFAHKNRLKMVK